MLPRLATLLLLLPTARQQQHVPPCSPNLLTPPDAYFRDAFLLTAGQNLPLSCGICGVCLPSDSAGCNKAAEQLWMTEKEKAKERIKQDNKYDSGWKKEVTSFRGALNVAKAAAKNLKAGIVRTSRRMHMKVTTAIHRFDRLRQLMDQSDTGVGLFKELRRKTGEDAAVMWFHEAPDGSVKRVKHEADGIKLVFDTLQIQRLRAAHTGVYACQMNGRLRARYVVTVAAGGTEPYREFSLPERSLRSKIMPKANLKIYTRWLVYGRPIKMNTVMAVHGTLRPDETIKIKNITWEVGTCYVKQMDPDKSTKPETSPLLRGMPFGLPCRSHLLPLSVKSLRSVIHRPSEIRQESRESFISMRSLNFGGGQKKSSRTLPEIDMEMMIVQRSLDMAKSSEFVSLSCPLKRRARGLLVWFVLPPASASATVLKSAEVVQGTIDPMLMRRSSRGRRYTDPGGNLNIANVQRENDSYKYFCMDENKIVGYVKLVVRDSKAENFAVYITDQMLAMVRLMAPIVMVTSVVALAVVAASPFSEPPSPW